MNKFLIGFVSIVAVVLIGGAALGGWYLQNKKFQESDKKITAEITEKSAEVDRLKSIKDDKGYSPKDVATNFMNEFKTGSEDKAKLYLAESLQTVDLMQALKVEKDADKITLTEINEEIAGETATSTIIGFINDEASAFNAVLTITKENGLWKINKIN